MQMSLEVEQELKWGQHSKSLRLTDKNLIDIIIMILQLA